MIKLFCTYTAFTCVILVGMYLEEREDRSAKDAKTRLKELGRGLLSVSAWPVFILYLLISLLIAQYGDMIRSSQSHSRD